MEPKGTASTETSRTAGKGAGRGVVDENVGARSEEVATPAAAGGLDGLGPNEIARVAYGSGITLNLGNFQSARVDVRLEMPVRPNPDSIDLVYGFSRDWVEERLEAEVDRILHPKDDGGD